jgi:predicted short-subunit dehydrogenase-like oxidoreductase (DUF2520 family)
MGSVPIHVTLIGAGQVGRALAKALRAQAVPHRLLAFRRGLPSNLRATRLVLIFVRDRQIPDIVNALGHTALGPRTVVAHVSGMLGPEVLAPLKPHCRAVAQLHPFSSIRSIGHAHQFRGSYFLGAGDRAAQPTLRQFVRLLAGKFVRGDGVDLHRYHLAAALLANGSVALLHSASRLLTHAGIGEAVAGKMLFELQNSVLYNVERLGLERALTGPVRRGDIGTLRRHFVELEHADRTTQDLYRSLVRSQLEIVRGLGELEPIEIRRLVRLAGR